MQSFSVCRKRCSLIQRRRSTSSVCMMAICPAGPPKLLKPSFNQKQKVSAKLTAAGADAGPGWFTRGDPGAAYGASNTVAAAAARASSSACSARRLDNTLSSPAASGTGMPPASRWCTTAPKRCSLGPASSPKAAHSSSKVTRAPTWLKRAPSEPWPKAPRGIGAESASHGNCACGSMWRRISQALARRSTRRRARVPQRLPWKRARCSQAMPCAGDAFKARQMRTRTALGWVGSATMGVENMKQNTHHTRCINCFVHSTARRAPAVSPRPAAHRAGSGRAPAIRTAP